jgi:predicted nucleotidyltransferase
MFNKLKEEFRNLNIGIIYLFGSTAQGLSRKDSDIDIGIVFINVTEDKSQFAVYEKLYSLFSGVYEKETDIVFLQSASLSLQLNAVKYGKVIYETSSNFRADYEERVTLLYSDFEPVLAGFDKMVLERI